MKSLGRVTTPLIKVGESKIFAIFGKSFLKTTAIYLSGNSYDNLIFFNPFSTVPKLSTQNPGFYGVLIDSTQYKLNADTSITLIVPPPVRVGNIDIVLQNEAGWGSLSHYTIKNTINPYPLNHPLRSSWLPYEKPWKNGIMVV